MATLQPSLLAKDGEAVTCHPANLHKTDVA